MDDIDIGVAMLFLWGGFIFVGFVIVLSILQALTDWLMGWLKKEEEE